ncbi:MAG TPA: DUF2950 family protein [Steroidobacteraceae bacterium]|nr:DUF2950 family protein [Steroidobacteraceae bacterium]
MRMAPEQRSSRSKEFEMIRAMKSGYEKHRLPKSTACAALAACVLFAAGSVELCLAGPSSQTTFASPDDASHALASAVQQHDERTVREILGGGSGLISSNDQVEDALDRERFAQKYREMHRLVRDSRGITTLYIGAENWPFPVPLVSRNGLWRFESKVGSEEIQFRRIGENEVTAIGMCATLVTAKTHPGTDSEADRLVKTLLPQVEQDGKPILFRGYYFRILSNSGGGIAAIAYPAMYRSSGVMTFIATQNGRVTEKDLGPNTPKIAGAMSGYHADASWTAAE